MTSAAFSSGASGALTGATSGFMVGGPVGAVAGGVIGLVGGFLGGSAQDASQENQAAWQQYNNIMSYNTAVANLESQMALATYNAQALKYMSDYQAYNAQAAAGYNAALIDSTIDYNNLLLDEEIESVWEALDLDLTQLENFKNRETGSIIADQAGSGTVIGEGSNAEVVISQQTQRALDANIIMFNADKTVAGIKNKQAQSTWEGMVAIQQTMWQGEQQANEYRANAAMQAQSSLLQASLQTQAGLRSANSGIQSGYNTASLVGAAQENQNSQNLISGLFKGAGQVASLYYRNKEFDTSSIDGSPTVEV